MSTDLRKISKSNALIEASYKLKTNEQRLVLACIAKIDSRHALPASGIKITAQEFADCYK
ncbi:MAG: replication initiation protein [Candidatus Thiodiazotropha taylori]|nr:replication initiation protein [Candidatus Thiodiazotropha taylori]MCG8105199.1 replication initiation protein [Candidatus Thiodiazotropha taylori]MCG8113368.1 replication initiation protein [Candidatus Thiodiazotropha taylori]MCW4277534.1 replication initiation protein [Candidatus Thiodiazotropha taylori]MCW4285729.1 replication initiation protein [Candidatus Thiodiazotropha taylori]